MPRLFHIYRMYNEQLLLSTVSCTFKIKDRYIKVNDRRHPVVQAACTKKDYSNWLFYKEGPPK